MDAGALGLDLAGEGMSIGGLVIGAAVGDLPGAIEGYGAGNAMAQATTNRASNVLSLTSTILSGLTDYLNGDNITIATVTAPIGNRTINSAWTTALGFVPETTVDLIASSIQFFGNDRPYYGHGFPIP